MTANSTVLKATIAALGLLLLSGQQDMPLRPPGRFSATTTGLLKGTITGDISVSTFRDGHREIYLQMDSSQMMATNIMISLQVTLPVVRTAPVFRLQVENLKTHQLSYPAATGTLALKGRDLLTGSFTVTSTDKTLPLTLTGTLDNAPVVPAVE